MIAIAAILLVLILLLTVVWANIFPGVNDDTAYCSAVTLPATEADLGTAVEVTSAAAVNATTLTVGALNAALASGTVLTFPVAPGSTFPTQTGTVQATLTAAASVNATSLTVSPLPGPIAANTYALYQGAPVTLPPGTQSVQAIVQLVTTVHAAGATYVVLQTDLGDGNWVDVAWISVTAPSVGTANYALSTALGAVATAAQRSNGSAPASSGTNAMALGPRIRFTGQSTVSSSSVVTATIKYRVQGLR